MPAQTISRRWTVATWLAAGVEPDSAADALRPLGADAIALQSVTERTAESIASALGMRAHWDLSHYPVTRLFFGSGLGLAVLTPHTIGAASSAVISSSSSTWSRNRRIGQVVVVERDDRSGYAIVHSVAAGEFPIPTTAPAIRILPAQVGVDEEFAIQLPQAATRVDSHHTPPPTGQGGLLTVTFDMDWVVGDYQ